MNSSLPLLIQRLLAARPSTPAWHSALDELVEAVLKGRKIAKRYSSQPLEGVYQEMYAELKDRLVEAVRQMALDESLAPTALKSVLHQVSQDILTYNRLTQMAVHLQQQRFRSPLWQHALNALFDAVYLSGKLKRPATYGDANWDAHLDITNEALMQAIKDIQKFDPARAHFIGWVNQVYIVRRSATTRQRQKDTLTQGYQRQVMPIKYALSKTLSRSQNAAAKAQFVLYLKGVVENIEQDCYLYLSLVICLLQKEIERDPTEGSEMLFEMAQMAVGREVVFENLDAPKQYEDGGQGAREIPSPFQAPPQLDFLRECLRTCQLDKCADILQKHLRSNPQATFQAIALLRIEGKTLKEIANLFEVLIPTVQLFYERNMLKAADSLKICVEDKIALWEMHHPPA